ncbi:MAG: hydroxyisourate hydrolase [Chitinophagaceae bacterium]
MSQITAHILDTTRGRPVAGVQASLLKQQENEWKLTASGTTDNNGRIANFLPHDSILDNGIYKIKFFTREYFTELSMPAFYPYIEVVFEISSTEHYHIPLLVSPFGYTTYRGS